MSYNDESSKFLFITSMYRFYVEQQCIEMKRKTLLRIIRLIDGFAGCTPAIILFLIGETRDNITMLLRIAGISSILVAISKYLPIHKKEAELSVRSLLLESLIWRMELLWREYKFNIIDLTEFTQRHKLLYDEYRNGLDRMSEVYNFSTRIRNSADRKARVYMTEFIENPSIEIDRIYKKIREGKMN